jgi:hypothetical protein
LKKFVKAFGVLDRRGEEEVEEDMVVFLLFNY